MNQREPDWPDDSFLGQDRPQRAHQLSLDVQLDLARETFLQAVVTSRRQEPPTLDEVSERRLRRLLEQPPSTEIDTDGSG